MWTEGEILAGSSATLSPSHTALSNCIQHLSLPRSKLCVCPNSIKGNALNRHLSTNCVVASKHLNWPSPVRSKHSGSSTREKFCGRPRGTWVFLQETTCCQTKQWMGYGELESCYLSHVIWVTKYLSLAPLCISYKDILHTTLIDSGFPRELVSDGG